MTAKKIERRQLKDEEQKIMRRMRRRPLSYYSFLA
jgi:hypothetical protein